MSDKTARGPTFPTTCARCGGRLSGPVSFCPHCGVEARHAFGERMPSNRPERVSSSASAPGPGSASAAGAGAGASLAEMLRLPRPTPLFASPDGDPYGDVGVPPSAASTSSTRWSLNRWAFNRWALDRVASNRWDLRRWDIRGWAANRWALNRWPMGRSSMERWRSNPWAIEKRTVLILLAFVVLYGGTVLLHRYDDVGAREPRQTSVQGAVTTAGAGAAQQAAGTSRGPTIARESGSLPAAAAVRGAAAAGQRSATAVTSAQPSGTAAHPANGDPLGSNEDHLGSIAASQSAPPAGGTTQAVQQLSSAQSKQATATSSSSTTSGKQYSAKNQRLMSLALARAHNGFDKNDLRMARSGVFWALSLQPDNSEALALKEQLLAREKGHVAASKAFDSSDE